MGDGNSGGPSIRRAQTSDWAALTAIDPVAGVEEARRESIRRWCEHGSVLVAEESSAPVGYGVLEYTFFEQGFLTLLTVAPHARRRGVATRLVEAVEAACTTAKLFTSTNVSNHPMQRLLHGVGRHPVGLVHGLDEGDPELFHLCPGARLGGAGPAGG
ncbi:MULTISPECIES: GNAT family N-acetyltransferase [unclassified Streptomyces]|uniref:GNAT family N-acetyltransferase n=1 Tax=unclassified Streptomyces TaxID=2593676 RepID=UPI0020364785|nr:MULTISPECIES: GNAT family N-acetyltransferase [unclassified Streptomyces]